MAEFKTIVEAVLRNNGGGVLNRVEIKDFTNSVSTGKMTPINKAFIQIATYGLAIGDTITIEERQTEVV
jgi:hypothetical protein